MSSLIREPRLFGSPRRTEVLLLVAMLGETYPAELTRLTEASKASILNVIDSLEAEGVLASRALGRSRRVALDPRYFAAKELAALLRKLAQGQPRLQAMAASRRARPRRKGKGL